MACSSNKASPVQHIKAISRSTSHFSPLSMSKCVSLRSQRKKWLLKGKCKYLERVGGRQGWVTRLLTAQGMERRASIHMAAAEPQIIPLPVPGSASPAAAQAPRGETASLPALQALNMAISSRTRSHSWGSNTQHFPLWYPRREISAPAFH